MENNIHSHGSPAATYSPTDSPTGSPPGSPLGTPIITPIAARDAMNQITISNSKTNFNNNFEEVELFNSQLPNNSDSVGKPLSDILTHTGGKLNLYRAGSIAKTNSSKIRLIEGNDNVGISFYGTSRAALIKYDKQHPNKSIKTEKLKKTYYRMVLSSDDTVKLVDLHLPENTNRILRFLLSKNSDEDKRILIKTLFYESDINNYELIRYSKNVDEDVEMARILMKIFPDAIGIYTRQGLGHSHNEVIIWNRTINEKLQQARKRKANNTTYNGRTKNRVNITRPRTNGNENENITSTIKTLKFGNGNGNRNRKRSRRNGKGIQPMTLFT